MDSFSKHARHYLERYWGFLVLLLWGACLIGLGLLRDDRYGIDEGAARALILNWAVFDRVLNPLITLGVPDFRSLLFIPLGAYWSGSLFAAKVYTMLMAFAAIAILYRWVRRHADSEAALIGCGLLLVFPLLINQIDAIGTGVYLLLAFTVGAWISGKVDNAPRNLSAWYFILMIWVLITITIHPAGIGFPLALAWHWQRNVAADHNRRKSMFIGLGLVVVITLAMRGGWSTIEWFNNPFVVLGQSWHALTGITGEPNMLVASLLAIALGLVVWADRRFVSRDVLGLTMVLAIALGLLVADPAWALIAVTLVLLRGSVHLIALNQAIAAGRDGLLLNRGLVLAMFFIVSTTSMFTDKIRVQAIVAGEMDQRDKLIRVIAHEVDADPEAAEFLQIASEWPGRTMIAARVNTFQLPPDLGLDNEGFLASIRGITHLMFDPTSKANASLARHVAELSGLTQTVDLNEEGVIVRVLAWDSDTPLTDTVED